MGLGWFISLMLLSIMKTFTIRCICFATQEKKHHDVVGTIP